MSRVIYFRLGDKDRPPFSAFLRSLYNVKGLLADFDAAVSRDPRGTVRWEVAVLQKKSPIILGVVGEPIRRRAPVMSPPNVDLIEDELMDSTAKLSLGAQRTVLVSDSAIERYRELATQSAKLGEIAVYTNETEVPINEQTLQNIQQLTGTKSKAVGSILGNLDTISVHNNNEIRVWDENTKRPVRCRYPVEMEETIKSWLRERVLVNGLVSFNRAGQATSVEVSNIARYPRANELPTIEQVSGLIDDMTDGASLADYLEHLRDG